MRILTLDNEAYAMNEMPEKVDDVRFCILDNSNPADPDYFFIPLIFLESFNAPAVVIQLGKYKIPMPVDWHIGGFDPNSSIDFAYRILVKEIQPEYNFNELPESISWVQS